MKEQFEHYEVEGFFDETFAREDNSVRPMYRETADYFANLSDDRMKSSLRSLERTFLKQGVTFTVYSDGQGTERIFPFDPVPRIIPADEWAMIEQGLRQRIQALNLFLKDIYSDRRILKEGIVPEELIKTSKHNRAEFAGVKLPHDTYIHICGTDLIRDNDGRYCVLEDNGRCPSGVSYMLENREIMMRMFPQLFQAGIVEAVDSYPSLLKKTLEEVAPIKCDDDPTVVLLTPGSLNSAYYEHSFLADLMGIELVEPQDLFVENGLCWMRTTRGPQRVDVIYRRIDDTYIDPLAFKADSLLGVPGIFDVYRSGGVTLCSAPGAGVADDKAIYVFVPDMIRFYLGEKPILENVQTWRCAEPDHCKYVIDNLKDLVVKRVHGSGGYGMLIGPHAAKKEIEAFRAKIRANPSEFIAQPTLDLSTAPILGSEGVEERHVDFRPYCLVGKDIRLTPGGLTRVALKKGSLVVNSSQGGGVKDTWILAE